MMMIAPFGIIAVLAVVGLLVAGVIALVVVFRGRALAWVLAVLALLALPMAALMWYRTSAAPAMRQVRYQDDRMLAELQRMEQQERVPVATAVLPSPLPAGEDMSAFLADVYPSAEQAVRAAARDAARSVASVGVSLPSPPAIRVSGRVSATLLSQAVQGIRQSGSQVGAIEMEVTGPEAPTTQPAATGKILCDVRVDADSRGAATVTLHGPEIQVSSAAQFRIAPWAADFGQFVSTRGDRRILAQSRRPCTSLEEAQRAALDDAAGQLLPAFQQAMMEYTIARGGRATGPAADGGANLRRVLTLDLERDNSAIMDRFPQRYARPYGEIWRQTLLVDSSRGSLNGRAQRICDLALAQKGAEVSTWSRLGMSIGGLLVLVLAVYLVLNAATKGYYSLVLRLAAVALVVAGTIVVFCMA